MLSGILDWIVVAIPVLIGFVAWVYPIQQATRLHRFFLFLGCVAFSGMIYWQQHEARKERKRELKNLPTKSDIARLPTAADIVKEFKSAIPGIREKALWGLTNEQLAKLTERVSIYASFSSDQSLIDSVLGDQESMKFADQLAGAFRAAHWKGVYGSGFSQSVFTKPVEGLYIKVRDQNDKPPGLFEFTKTLRESGIEPIGLIEPSIPKDEFRITVGSRPDK